MADFRAGRGGTLSFFFLTAIAFFPAGFAQAHCPGTPPNVTLTYLSPEVAIQRACYPDFGDYCQIDTFYQDALQGQLSSRYQASRFVFQAVVDTLASRLVFDTLWIDSATLYVDTLIEETLGMAVLDRLKGSVPESRLLLKDTVYYYPPGISPTTYGGLIDTPFVAFVGDSAYDHPEKLGIGPVDGCFFEPAAFMVLRGRIHKKGYESERIPGSVRLPGVSLSFDRFLAGAASASVPGFTRLDTATARLRFGYGHTKVRRVSPEGGRP